MPQEKAHKLDQTKKKRSYSKELYLHNDDVNTFEHVISTLVLICDHAPEQAEQCAIIVHLKGKCPIKNGSPQRLKKFKVQLDELGLITSIE